ncbi:hypothetical protein FZX02_00505 [Synechococcus sp. MU1644]|nr:hypothetical protein [Synechococcus sp. MU1644]
MKEFVKGLSSVTKPLHDFARHYFIAYAVFLVGFALYAYLPPDPSRLPINDIVPETEGVFPIFGVFLMLLSAMLVCLNTADLLFKCREALVRMGAAWEHWAVTVLLFLIAIAVSFLIMQVSLDFWAEQLKRNALL